MRSVEDRGVRLVRMWFTDILGNLKSFAISPAELENALEDGMTFDGSSIEGFSRIQESDVLAIPDADTFELLPWGDREVPEARVFCDIHKLDGTPFDGDPRQVLRRHVRALHDQGLAFYVAPDIEFFYFEPPTPGQRPKPLDEGGFFDLTTNDITGSLRKQTIRTLETMGIPVEYSFHEDAPSQQEIDLRHTDALTMPDSVMTFRLIVREVAASQGLHATFMPKPMEGVQGSGMHTHLSLFRGDENAFFDEDDDYYLSDLAKAFMAGLLHHAAEITAVTNQTVNSYKRLVPGYESPVEADANLFEIGDEVLAKLGIEQLPQSLSDALRAMERSDLVHEALGGHIYEWFLRNKRTEWRAYKTHVSNFEVDRYLKAL